MLPSQMIPNPNEDHDSSTYSGANTPPETVAAADLIDDQDPFAYTESKSYLVPWPNSTFTIRCVSSGHLITLLDGQIVLAQPGNQGSTSWACVENKGWLGFRNVVSGKMLGHDKHGRLCCLAQRHSGWEHFCVRMKPEGGGCVLLMKDWDSLWHVGIKKEEGVERLAKIGEGGSDGVVWEFIEA